MAKLICLLVLIAGLVSACGGGGGEAEPSKGAEDELAGSMLLTVSDFPTGWSEQPDTDEDTDSPLSKCSEDNAEQENRTGSAETGEFSEGGSASISEKVVIYDSAESIAASWELLEARGECVVKGFNAGLADSDDAEFSDASFSPLSFPKHGDRSAAYRFKVHGKAKGISGFGSELDAYIDVVYVSIGRYGFSITAYDVFSPYDSEELDEIVSKGEDRVESATEDQ